MVAGLQIMTETCGRDSSRANQTFASDPKHHRLPDMLGSCPAFGKSATKWWAIESAASRLQQKHAKMVSMPAADA